MFCQKLLNAVNMPIGVDNVSVVVGDVVQLRCKFASAKPLPSSVLVVPESSAPGSDASLLLLKSQLLIFLI